MKQCIDIEELYEELVARGQERTDIKWGEIIKYKPSEVYKIAKEICSSKERKKWIEKQVYFFGTPYYECPYCQYSLSLNGSLEDNRINYCPHCGEKVGTG